MFNFMAGNLTKKSTLCQAWNGKKIIKLKKGVYKQYFPTYLSLNPIIYWLALLASVQKVPCSIPGQGF